MPAGDDYHARTLDDYHARMLDDDSFSETRITPKSGSTAPRRTVRGGRTRRCNARRNRQVNHRMDRPGNPAPRAIISEGEDEASRAETFEDNRRRVPEIRSRANLGAYLGAAAAGTGVTPGSPEDELNAALELRTSGGGVPIPWAMMLEAGRGPVEARETRVFTETSASDGSNIQRPILQRLFGPGLMDALGVRLDSVPVGRSEWPLLTGAVAPAQAKEGTAAAAAPAATFDHASLKPKRLNRAVRIFSHEVSASVPGVERLKARFGRCCESRNVGPHRQRGSAHKLESSVRSGLFDGHAPHDHRPFICRGDGG